MIFVLVDTGDKYPFTQNIVQTPLWQEAAKMGLTGTTGDKPLSLSMTEKILKDPFYCGYAVSKKHKVKFPHRYPKLITEATFNCCQSILAGRRVDRKTYATKEFIFKGLLRCAACKGAISGDIKKGKYVFYSCSGYKGCKKITVAERELLKPIYKILDNLQKPTVWVEEVVALMQQSQEDKQRFQKEQLQILRKRYQTIQESIDMLPKLLLEKRIDEGRYDRLLQEYKDKQREVEAELALHTGADEQFYITVKTVLSLSQRAREIFESSKVSEKRQLLSLLLSNSVLDWKKPVFTIREPFNYLVSLGGNPVGLRMLNDVRT